jgi:hypothetical protein
MSFSLTFVPTPGNQSIIFSGYPQILLDSSTKTGTLIFEAALGSFGNARFNVVLSDNGGTENSGLNTSGASAFDIEVVPLFKMASSGDGWAQAGRVTVNENCGPIRLNSFFIDALAAGVRSISAFPTGRATHRLSGHGGQPIFSLCNDERASSSGIPEVAEAEEKHTVWVTLDESNS